MDGQPELTEDDEGPKSRIRDIGGRVGRSGEEAQGGQGTGREWYDGTPYMPLQRLSQSRRIDLQNARSLKNKSHPGLMARAHVSPREFISKYKHDMYKMSPKRRSLDYDRNHGKEIPKTRRACENLFL